MANNDDDDIEVHGPSPWHCEPGAIPYAVAAKYASTDSAGRAMHVLTHQAIQAHGGDDLGPARQAVDAYTSTVSECGPLSAEARWCARTVAEMLDAWGSETVFDGAYGVVGKLLGLVDAWRMLAADPGVDDDIVAAAYIVTVSAELYSTAKSRERLSKAAVVAGWQGLAVRPPPPAAPAWLGVRPPTDLLAAAHKAAVGVLEIAAEAAAAAEEDAKAPAGGGVPGGIVVLKALGGLSKTSAGKDAAREFEGLVGQAIPRVRVPSDLAMVREVLVAEFPYAERAIVALLTDIAPLEWVRLRPTILVGEPGGGKSRLVRRLAEELGLHLSRLDCGASADNSIGGCPRRWATGEPSWPLLAIKSSMQANPLVMLDELDKVAGDQTHNGRLDVAILAMLAGETSRSYPDPYLQAPCDLSWVSWIATANDDSRVSPPLRDRMRTLRIPRPGPEHLSALVRSICREVVVEQGFDARWAAGGLDGDEQEVAAKLWKGGSVRKLRAIVERLLARRQEMAAWH